MSIVDDNPQVKVKCIEFIDTGAANTPFIRNYVYDECGELTSTFDIDQDGNPYTVVGPYQKQNAGTTVLDVTGIETTTTLTDNLDGTATYINEDNVSVTITLGSPLALTAADIDTLAELNAILTDATLIDEGDLDQEIQDRIDADVVLQDQITINETDIDALELQVSDATNGNVRLLGTFDASQSVMPSPAVVGDAYRVDVAGNVGGNNLDGVDQLNTRDWIVFTDRNNNGNAQDYINWQILQRNLDDEALTAAFTELYTALGLAPGNTSVGAFPGTLLTDSVSVFQSLIELEGFVQTNIDDISNNVSAIALNTAKISATGNEVEFSDMDTLSELNTIITDATLIDTTDSRLSDARTPLAHTHTKSEITDFNEADYATAAQGALADTATQPGDLGTVATSNDYNDLDNIPTIPPAAPVDSVNGQTGVVVITATDVGLGNVDNTSDIDKPVSTAQQTALDGKVDDSQVLTNVPAGAVFTDNDTIYDDTAIQAQITSNDTDISTNAGAIVTEAATRASADTLIQNQLDAHEADINNPHSTTFTQAVTADAGTDITAAEAEELTDGSVTQLHRHKSIVQASGRFDLFLNNNWVSWSDANFGINQADWDQQLGAGATPTVDWDGNGMLFPAGTVLKSITIKARANNAQVSAVELFARAHDVDLTAGSPIDSIAEIGAVDVVAPFTQDLTNGGSNAGNDMQAFSFSLNDYTFNNIGDFHLMCRIDPGATITANRQLRCTVYIEVEYP